MNSVLFRHLFGGKLIAFAFGINGLPIVLRYVSYHITDTVTE